MPIKTNQTAEEVTVVSNPYKDEEEKKAATTMVEQISCDLEKREKHTVVFNGMEYTSSYLYNQRKAINYAAPRGTSNAREISYGLVHEKIIGFCSFFLKNIYKRQTNVYDESGSIVQGMGKVYDLGIEHSYRLEKMVRKVSLIYWEAFTQGMCAVFEEWQVKNIIERVAKDPKGNIVKPEDMDYSFEFLDNLTWEDGEMIQERKAISRIMDGRTIIFGNPELNDVQEMPRITIEDVISRVDAKSMYESLSRWDSVPKEKTQIDGMWGNEQKITLFDTERLGDSTKQVMRHFVLDKENNRYNLILNGVMMLPRDTSFKHFYPRNNYPISIISTERLTGSIYPRSMPAKTKFNADFIDWALTKLADKFEQGIDPALLVKGKYTLTKDLFKGGQRTHGVGKDDYDKADPENKGITSSEFGFVGLLKEIVEGQTLNATTSGETESTTATAVNAAQANQIEKLGYILDGIMNGFADMAERRAETIESKYTTKQSETLVDGKRIPVYQNFVVSMDGKEQSVTFDDSVGSETYDEDNKRDELFEKSFKDMKKGKKTAYHIVNPDLIRKRKFTFDIELKPERRKDTYLQIIEMREEADFLLSTWGNQIDKDVLSKEYINITGRPDKLFIPSELVKEEQPVEQGQNGNGGFGQKGAVKEAVKVNASAR